MKNRDKLLNMSLYDLLVYINDNDTKQCIIRTLLENPKYDRCKSFENCEKCIESYLNETE